MSIVGVIAEYNPFHKGHEHHLLHTKKFGDTIMAVISGNFVQRGEPAVCDKWYRTKMALLGGADLVIELPLYYATASAGYFAKGAVQLLNATGIVDKLCFGSESNDIAGLIDCAKRLMAEDESFKVKLRGYLKEGLSYPAARQKVLESENENFSLLKEPNNTLGVEYIKALAETGSVIEAVTVPRSPGSAQEIRTALQSDKNIPPGSMPDYASQLLEEASADYGLAFLNNPAYNFLFKALLLKGHLDSPDMTEDLRRRYVKQNKNLLDIYEIIAQVKSKNYTHTRLQRAVLHSILGITEKKMLAYEEAGGPQYIRVLGFRKAREDLLKMLVENAALPVVTNLKNANFGENSAAAQMLADEAEASRLYYLAVGDGNRYFCREEYRQGLVVV